MAESYTHYNLKEVLRGTIHLNLLNNDQTKQTLYELLNKIKIDTKNFLEDNDLYLWYRSTNISSEESEYTINIVFQEIIENNCNNSAIIALLVFLSEIFSAEHYKNIFIMFNEKTNLLKLNNDFGCSYLYEIILKGKLTAEHAILYKNFSIFPTNTVLSQNFQYTLSQALLKCILGCNDDLKALINNQEFESEFHCMATNNVDEGYYLWAYLGHILAKHEKMDLFRSLLNRCKIIKYVTTDKFVMDAEKQQFPVPCLTKEESYKKLPPLLYNNVTKFTQVFSDIFALLCDVKLCCKILYELNKDLRDSAQSINTTLDYASYIPKEYLYIEDLFFPGDKPINLKLPRKYYLLNLLLLENEQKHGINLPDSDTLKNFEAGIYPVPTFAEFVKHENAKKIIQDGHIFHEYPFLGNSLTHGKYTHRLQWYIIMKAIELKLIDPQNLTVKQILQESVEDNKYNLIPWNELFDKLYQREHFGFSSVQAVNSFMLTTSDTNLQDLRGYLTISLWDTAEKISHICPHMKYEEIILLHVSHYRNFSTKTILQTDYNASKHIQDHLVKENGIIWKKNKEIPPGLFFENRNINSGKNNSLVVQKPNFTFWYKLKFNKNAYGKCNESIYITMQKAGIPAANLKSYMEFNESANRILQFMLIDII
ncbi:MAG: hypothetical protein KC414_11025, partial [Romboutsia sp.]|nr:hypothetical protein [Romboutsia sp.]